MTCASSLTTSIVADGAAVFFAGPATGGDQLTAAAPIVPKTPVRRRKAVPAVAPLQPGVAPVELDAATPAGGALVALVARGEGEPALLAHALGGNEEKESSDQLDFMMLWRSFGVNRRLLEELRLGGLDEGGRRLMSQALINSRAVLRNSLPAALSAELAHIAPLSVSELPSCDELRVTAATTVGWAEEVIDAIKMTMASNAQVSAGNGNGVGFSPPPQPAVGERALPVGFYM